MKIRQIKESGTQVVDKVEKYFHIHKDQFLQYFFDINSELTWVDESEPADICVYSVQLEDESKLRSDEVNVFFSIENLKHWSYRGHYKFFNKFNWDSCNKTNIYIHNDTHRIIKKDKYIIFPTVYFRVDYFNRIKSNYDLQVPWENKRFCLFISQNFLNKNKEKLVNTLATLGPVNHINDFSMLLRNKSCYNSNDLLKVFSFYKFVICCENSQTQGYVTEKIFNVLLANSIPVYDGAPDIERYINKDRFLKQDDQLVSNVKRLMNDEAAYKEFVSRKAINESFDDENFKETYKKALIK
jgi:hypothetical protein